MFFQYKSNSIYNECGIFSQPFKPHMNSKSFKPFFRLLFLLFFLSLVITSLTSCRRKRNIQVDGSSTVYPITEAVAEEFGRTGYVVDVSVGASGTGGGFKKFCKGETDISDASRPVKGKEIKVCEEAGIHFVELPVAYDGLAVVINPKNKFIKNLNVEQLNHIFRYENPARTWKDVNPEWPADHIKIFAPGQDSGTYDYFVETIIGDKGRLRSDSMFSEDDNVLVVGIANETNGIGFFGLAYYEENMEKLKVVPVINPKLNKPVEPSIKTVMEGTYAPLSRPLFIYVKENSLKKQVVKDFVDFYMNNVGDLCREVGYVPLGEENYAAIIKHYKEKVTGSLYTHEKNEGKTLLDIYGK